MPAKTPALPPYSHQPKPYHGPSTEEVLKLRKEHLTPSLFHYYKKPLMLVEGSMQYLYDEKGRRYLHHLSPPWHRPIRKRVGRLHARRPQSLLLR